MAMQVSGYYPSYPAPSGGAVAVPTPVQPMAARPMAPAATATAMNPDTIMQVSSAITPLTAGVAPGLKVARQVTTTRGVIASARRGSMRAMRAGAPTMGGALMSGVWSAVKMSLLFKGVASIVTNGIKLYKHQETVADAGTNVVGDLMSSVVAGSAAGLAGGLGAMLLGGALGTGLMLTVVTSLIGAAAFFVADNLLRETSFYNNIKASVHTALNNIQ